MRIIQVIDKQYGLVYGRALVVDPSAEENCFTNLLLRANFATDGWMQLSAARRVAEYLVGATHDWPFKTIRVCAVPAQKASSIRTCFKTIWQRVVLSHPNYYVLKCVNKQPLADP